MIIAQQQPVVLLVHFFHVDEEMFSFTAVLGKESGSIMALALDLQDFLLRARVLKLYRQALRITRRAPVDARGSMCSFEILMETQLMFTGELRSTIRQELENNRHCNDRQRIRFFLSEGLERLKRLDEMLDMQGHPE
ncbi:unnamed protein product [Prunus armeniaca]|uniref:Complex 1 LYR protein domain-containing protein n=1 Tax=Prunus armeniaca TaxID=36596 RepID=A0A6J5TPA2_PRUAR|nr:unnamed protein product [Prunus armeniaca]